MISSKALLKNVARPLVLFTGLGVAPAANAFPFHLRHRQDWHEKKLGEELGRDLGYHGAPQAKASVDAEDLVRIAFGGRLPRGLHVDRDLVRPLSVDTTTDLSPISFVNLSQNTKGGQTDAEAEYQKSYGSIFSPGYLQQEKQVFRAPRIDTRLYPLDTPEAIRRDRSQEFHEALHGYYAHQQAMLDLLLDRDRPANLGDSKVWGHGPKLEALLASQETPAETAERHRHLQNFLSGNASDSDYQEYGVFDNELHSYFGQVLAQGISSGKWKRLPETKGELWAAAYHSIGQQPRTPFGNKEGANILTEALNAAVNAPLFAPEGDNEVSRFLASPEGKKALKQFPQIPFSGAAYQLCQGLDRLKSPNRARFYSEVLPEIYGEILEELRDGQGMTRMGLTAGPNYGLSYADHLMHAKEGGAWAWSDQAWKRVAGKVEPEVFANVAALSIVHPKPVALEALLEVSDRRGLLTAQQKADLLQGALGVASRAPAAERNNALQDIAILEKHGATLKK